MKDNEYKCQLCGGIFEKVWSNEEAENEMKELWGELKEEERVVICDDCFKMVYPSKNLELARKCGYKK